MNGKKEYSIVINGVTSAIKDVTKLTDALEALDKKAKDGVKVSATVEASVKAKAKALTEEEKAQKKLADTKAKIARADSEENKAQVLATQQLRDKNREISRQVALNELAEGSIASMGMQLTDLRREYELLSEEERINAEVGGALLTQIQELDKKYKHLRESTGNFRDSVGNYEKALGALDKLNKGVGGLSQTANGLTTAFNGSNSSMQVFSFMALNAKQVEEDLNKAILLTTLAMQIGNAVTAEGTVVTLAKAGADKIATVQLKAKTLAEAYATKGTVLATIAQTAFNVVAYANPYVLLALALVALVGVLYTFISSTDDATDSQKKLNEEQNIWLGYLDAEASKLKLVSDSRVGALERELKLLNAKGAKVEEIRALEDKILREKQLNNARLRGLYSEEVNAIEENREKLSQYVEMLRMVKLAQARGESKMLIDIDLNGQAKKVKIDEALDIVQGRVDMLNRKIEIGVSLKTDEAELYNELEVRKLAREKADKEEASRLAKEAKAKAEEAKQRARDIANAELEERRRLEDLKAELSGKSLEVQREVLSRDYARQIEDLKNKLKTEEKLNAEAKKAINGQIEALEKIKVKKLEEINAEFRKKELEAVRAQEDAETALILGAFDRRVAEISIGYDRQIEAIKERLATETDLTVKQVEALGKTVVALEKRKQKELQDVSMADTTARVNLEMQATETALKAGLQKIGDVIKRDRITGVLDADATKDNLKKANELYKEYISGLLTFQSELRASHAETIAGLQVGSVEYETEMQRFATANIDATNKIREAQKAITNNNEAFAGANAEMWRGIAGEVAKYATLASDAITAITDTLNAGLQAQLDALNDKLEETTKHYEDAKAKREEYTQNVVDLETKLRDASGGTADALKEQLSDAMHLREESAREEQRLQREKEKREAEIAKKEKQMRKNDLLAKIAMGIANTAQGVTQMLSLMFPLNLVMAGIVGVAGAVQTGIMANQLAKMADGGEVHGATHANGGINVGGGMEWEGGEFLINRGSYAQNKALVNLINDSDTPISFAQMLPFASFGDLPVETVEGSDPIVEAINGINLKPVVSVVDIADAQDEVTSVKDLADF